MSFKEYGFIGKYIEVKNSKNKILAGIKAKVINETKNTVILDNGKKLLKNAVELVIIEGK